MLRTILASALALLSLQACGPLYDSSCSQTESRCYDERQTICDAFSCYDEVRQVCEEVCVSSDRGTSGASQCVSDSECRVGFRCESDGVCRAPLCRADSDCYAGQRCESDGRCRAVSSQATAGQLCESCNSSSECATGSLCLRLNGGGSVCGADCASNADCPSNFRCYDVGTQYQCAPISGSCPAGLSFTGCRIDSDCAAGDRCDGSWCFSPAGSGSGQ